MNTDPIEITTRRKYTTYSGGEKCNQFLVKDGTIRAWDEIAGYYTLCHSLTKRQESMINAEVGEN